MLKITDYESAKELFGRNHIALEQKQYEMFEEYAKLLADESEIQNVTAVHDKNEIWTRHFLDAAYLLQYLQNGVSVIDIGTGGGIPAIPLAIMNPTLKITMLDSELRKIEFCRKAIQTLNIHADAVSGRAEELAKMPEYRAKFDFAVSRAMANGSMLSELAIPFVKQNAALIAMKGRQFDPEFERFDSAADALGCKVESVQQYELEGEIKHLVTVRKLTETQAQYPRRFAKIKRAPL